MLNVTVYTAPACQGCRLTMNRLDKHGIDYQSQPLDDDTREAAMSLGITAAPVVCADVPGDRQWWGGFRPDRIDALKDLMP